VLNSENSTLIGYPFLLLDRVISNEEGKYIEAYKNVSISEPVF